jgi:hypothetical protein
VKGQFPQNDIGLCLFVAFDGDLTYDTGSTGGSLCNDGDGKKDGKEQ